MTCTHEYVLLSCLMKTCVKCGLLKSDFAKDRSRKDGLHPYCKDCKNSYKLRRPPRPKMSKEELAARANDRAKAWYANNRERGIERTRQWRKKNKPDRRPEVHRRNALKRAAAGSFSKEDILFILTLQNFLCRYCGIDISLKYSIDHIIPLSRGGTNWPWNIALACPRCNFSKGPKLPDEFKPLREITSRL